MITQAVMISVCESMGYANGDTLGGNDMYVCERY